MRILLFTQKQAINKIKYNKQKILFIPVFEGETGYNRRVADKPKDALTGGTGMPSVRGFLNFWGQTLRGTGGFDKVCLVRD